MSDTASPTSERAGVVGLADPGPRPQPLQVFGDPDATFCTGDSCEISAIAPVPAT